MIVAKNVVAFRLGDDTKSQLDFLESMDYKLAVSENRRPLTRTEIVEQAINNYYIQNTNEYKNDPQVKMMFKVMDELFQKYFGELNDELGKQWYDVRLLLLYVQVISRTLNFQEQPAEFALKFINGRYDFEDEIEAKVNRDLADSRIISLVKSIQDLQRESKKLRTESEEENENE